MAGAFLTTGLVLVLVVTFAGVRTGATVAFGEGTESLNSAANSSPSRDLTQYNMVGGRNVHG